MPQHVQKQREIYERIENNRCSFCCNLCSSSQELPFVIRIWYKLTVRGQRPAKLGHSSGIYKKRVLRYSRLPKQLPSDHKITQEPFKNPNKQSDDKKWVFISTRRRNQTSRLIKQSFNLSRAIIKCLWIKNKIHKKNEENKKLKPLGWTYLSIGEMYIMTKFVLI